MAGYLPPTEDLPIFDESVFQNGDEALTYNIAIKKFLRYPFAQGKETLQEIEVDGASVFNENIVVNNNSNITISTVSGGNSDTTFISQDTISITKIESFGDPTTTTFSTTAGSIIVNDSSLNSTTITPASVYLNNPNTGTELSLTTDIVSSNNWNINNSGDLTMGQNLILRDNTVNTSVSISKSANDLAITTTDSPTDTISFNVDAEQPLQIQKTKSIFNSDLTNVASKWLINNGSGNITTGNTITLNDYGNGTTADIVKSLNDLSINGTTNSDNISFHIGTKTALRLGFGNSTFDNNLTNINANWNINNTSGQGSFVNLVASGTQPGSGDNSSAVPTTNWVQSRITTLLGSANFWSGGSQTFSTGANIPSGANLIFVGAGNTQARISPATAPQNNLQINLTGGSVAEPLYLNNPGGVFTGTAINVGTAFGYSSGSSLFQNLTGVTAPAGFTFSSMTSTVANKILGIIPYTQPASNDNSQNLATTAWVQSMTSPLLGSNNTWTGTNTFNNTVSSNVVKTTPNGIIQVIASDGTTLSQFQQISTDLTVTVAGGGEFKILSQGTGILPTANNLAGTSLLWNVSSGRGESCIVNYQDSGGGVSPGGFDFYNVSSGATSTKIATISVAQPPANDSTTTLATTAWVQTAIVASATKPVDLPYTITGGVIFLDAQNNYFVNFGSASPITQNIIGYNFVNFKPDGMYTLSWSVSGARTLTKSPSGVAPQNVPFVYSNLSGNVAMANFSIWQANILFPVSITPAPSFIYTNLTS